jgi:hypothetical protein
MPPIATERQALRRLLVDRFQRGGDGDQTRSGESEIPRYSDNGRKPSER